MPLPSDTINRGESKGAGAKEKSFLSAKTGHKIELGMSGNGISKTR